METPTGSAWKPSATIRTSYCPAVRPAISYAPPLSVTAPVTVPRALVTITRAEATPLPSGSVTLPARVAPDAARAGCASIKRKNRIELLVSGRRQVVASRQGRRVPIGAPSGVSRAEKRRPRMARFPDLRIVAALCASSQAHGEPSDGPWTRRAGSRDESEASLAAYSGGTVWVFHPLPMAAGVSVELWFRLYQIASDARFSYDTMIIRSPLECSRTT